MPSSNISLCGAVDFLAAIFGRDPDELRLRYGIMPKHAKVKCIVCDKPTVYKLYCSKKCRWEDSHVLLSCPVCDTLFYRRKGYVIWHLNHPSPNTSKLQDKFYCSQKCLGVNIANTVGFGAHTENTIRCGRHKKWNYGQVYEMRDKTGWGAIKIGCALGIPSSTVGTILAKRSREITHEM